MRGALEGLPAHGTHVDALPAVHLLAVVKQHGGRREGAATLRALVHPALLLGRPALGQAGRHVSYLQWVANPGLYSVAAVCKRTDRQDDRHTLTQVRRPPARRLSSQEQPRIRPGRTCTPSRAQRTERCSVHATVPGQTVLAAPSL